MSDNDMSSKNNLVLMELIKKKYIRYHNVNKNIFDKINQTDYINFKYLNNLIETQFYNPDVVYFLLDFFTGVLDDNFKNVKEWLKDFDLKDRDKITQTYKLSTDNQNMSSFIIKAPMKNNNNLIVELFTALFGWNKLRETIPTFACIYGGFSCSKPNIIYEKLLKSWCTSDKDKVQYIISEKIPGETILNKMEKNISPVNMERKASISKRGNKVSSVNIQRSMLISSIKNKIENQEQGNYLEDEMLIDILTISLSCQIAFENFKGQHGNLDMVNIIKRPLEKEKWIKFSCLNPCWVKIKNIPTIINYNNSTIELDNQRYGSKNSLFDLFDPTKEYDPLYDIYLLLCNYIKTIKYLGAGKLFLIHLKILSNLISYFSVTLNMNLLLSNPLENHIIHYLSIDNSLRNNKSILGVVDYLLDQYPLIKTKYYTDIDPEDNVLMCHNDCDNINQITKNILRPAKIKSYEDLRIFILNNKDNSELIKKSNKYMYYIDFEINKLYSFIENSENNLKKFNNNPIKISEIIITEENKQFIIYPKFEELNKRKQSTFKLDDLKNFIYDLLFLGSTLHEIDNEIYKLKSLVSLINKHSLMNNNIFLTIEDIYGIYLSLVIKYKTYKKNLEIFQSDLKNTYTKIIKDVDLNPLKDKILNNETFKDLYSEIPYLI
jgi:hypothetical protein